MSRNLNTPRGRILSGRKLKFCKSPLDQHTPSGGLSSLTKTRAKHSTPLRNQTPNFEIRTYLFGLRAPYIYIMLYKTCSFVCSFSVDAATLGLSRSEGWPQNEKPRRLINRLNVMKHGQTSALETENFDCC